MKNWPFGIGFVVIGIVLAVAYWQFYRPAQQAPEQVVTPPTSQPGAASEIQHPLTTTPEELTAAEPLLNRKQPLPELKQSDRSMAELLAKLFADRKLDRYFLFENFIERVVVMVDNLPRPQLPVSHRPVKTTPGQFLATGDSGQLAIDPTNYQRYTPLIRMLAALDKQQVVAVYKRLYPLFQQAYEGLGYPNAYFNDRLIEVIDHLLTTPPVVGPVDLVQPKVLYLYADPALEELSAGRKILVRCGPENAAQIKALLHDYRRILTTAN